MKRAFQKWMKELEGESIASFDGIPFFQWTLEDEYDSRLSEALEYFSQRPDYLRQECQEHLIELDQMEARFIEIEEYEKCAAVRDLKLALQSRYKEYLS